MRVDARAAPRIPQRGFAEFVGSRRDAYVRAGRCAAMAC
jgi:hypothetical protein